MSAKLVVLAVLAGAVTLTSVAAASPDAAKQQVTITSNGMGLGSRLLDPLQDGLPPRQIREAAWSPDGRKIVYVSRSDRNTWDLYLINADGSGQRMLTSVGSATTAWSPDGRKIAFVGPPIADGSDRRSLFVINVDGSGKRRLASKGGDPAWSPDGRKIAFVEGSNLSVVNADGSGRRRLAGNQVPGSRTGGWMSISAWSPDGRKILFLSDKGIPCDACYRIYVVNADGSGERRLTNNRTPGPPTPSTVQSNFAPAWSPDGRRIAFVRTTGFLSPLGEVWVMNADGTEQRRLTREASGWPYFALAWSPDGQKLAFTSDRDGNAEIYSINTDGSGLRRLTGNPKYDGDGAWSPDGRRIVFVSNRDGHSEVFVMNADGSGQRKLS